MVEAKLIAVTQPVIGFPASGPEGILAHCARVSSDRKYEDRGKDFDKLLAYCMKNKHWSVFEMANAIVEVKAPRDITRQLLRHDFHFQEFSQRYSGKIEFVAREARRQDHKNRQNSTKDLPEDVEEDFDNLVAQLIVAIGSQYDNLLKKDVAKECARVILPEGLTQSTLYVNGTLRNWIHYLQVRNDPGVTQHEHVLLAREIEKVLKPAFPVTLGLLEKNIE